MVEDCKWRFRVSCHTEPGEQVGVIGSVESLGSWNPEQIVLLQPLGQTSVDKEETVWEAYVPVPTLEIEYRYCVCVILEPSISQPERVLAIKRWETNLAPRKLPKDALNSSHPTIEIFGMYEGSTKVDQGWLVKDSLVQFHLCSSKVYSDPIILYEKNNSERKVYCKITPVRISSSSSMESIQNGFSHDTTDTIEHGMGDIRETAKDLWPLMEVAVMKEGQCNFTKQGQFGVVANQGDFLVFQCRMLHLDTTKFMFDFYIEQPNEDIPGYVGFSFFLPSNLKENFGVATLPITSQKHLPIGELTVHYIVVNPMADIACNMKVSYARRWNDNLTGLMVGHRGAGVSYHSKLKSFANIRENTLASMKYAAEIGVDMVEIDVQLSKDHVPVVYHDYHVCISVNRKKEQSYNDLLQIRVKDMTLSQLQALKVYNIEEKGISKFHDEELEDHQPFPTLQKALETMPLSCGFNIEFKWNMLLKDGTYELKNPFELNHFMDIMLKVVLKYANSRKIVFSSFNPDICTMLRLKQNRYPIMFLTMGKSEQWPPYEDQRTSTIDQAIYYSTSADILGISVHTEDLMRDYAQMERALDHNLIIFCWGDANNNQETVKHLKSIGIHGIIVDKVDESSTKSKTECVFLCETPENSYEKRKAASQESDSQSDNEGSPDAKQIPNSDSSTRSEKHECTMEK